MSIELTGDMELLATFAKDAAGAITHARGAVKLATAGCLREAMIFAPVDLGNLRDSGSMTMSGNAHYSRGVVGFSANYAKYVEEGTSRMAPHAYLGPAFDRNTAVFLQAMKNRKG